MDENRKGRLNDFEMFLDQAYQYEIGIGRTGKISDTRHRRNDYVLAKLQDWKTKDPIMYERAQRYVSYLKELAHDPEALQEFWERRKKGFSIEEGLEAYEKQETLYDFSHLARPTLIQDSNMSSVDATIMQLKYGDKLVLISGKNEYYINKEPDKGSGINIRKLVFESDDEEIAIEEIGELHYQDWRRISDQLTNYRVIRTMNGNSTIWSVFTKISMGELKENPLYQDLVLNHLLSRKNMNLHNYGGYIGELGIGSHEDDEAHTIPIPEHERDVICFEAEAMSAVDLFQNQRTQSIYEGKKMDRAVGSEGQR